MKQLSQPSLPMYAVFGRGLDGDLYFIHMEGSVPGIWNVESRDLKGLNLHCNSEFFVDDRQWREMMLLLTAEWHKKHNIVLNSAFTRKVVVTFVDECPKSPPHPAKGWKLKILQCSRSYKHRTISLVVNTSDPQKAFGVLSMSPLDMGCWSESVVSQNHTAQTCKLLFRMSDGENLKQHVMALLELHGG